jgi:enterochelin esterase family protein
VGESGSASSSVVSRLEKAAAAGEHAEAARLGRCLSEVETPIVEPSSQPSYHAVTFAYVAGPDVDSVRLDSPINAVLVESVGEDPDSRAALRRVGRTDLWVLSVELPDRLRAPYRFELTRSGGSAELVLDPRNPRIYEEHWTPNFRKSELVLPGAPPQPWRDRSRREGTWESHQVEGRSVNVYVPAPVTAGDRRPGSLVVALGTMTFYNILPTGRLIDHLVREEAIEPPLVIAMDPLEGSEERSYAPEADYVADVLLPWARSRYLMPLEPDEVVVTGTSRRGLVAVIAAFSRPDAIGKALALSGSFYWSPEGEEPEWLARQLADGRRRDIRLYLAAGSLETVVTPRNRGLYLLATNRHLRDVLAAKGYPHAYEEVVGVHDEITWQSALAEGLVVLLSE